MCRGKFYLREGNQCVGPFHSRGDAERFIILIEASGESSEGIEILEIGGTLQTSMGGPEFLRAGRMPNERPGGSPPRSGNSILLVEDHRGLREQLVSALLELGYAADPAASCAEATTLIQSSSFSLILIDIGLPDGNGIELCRQIRTRDTTTPIIIYSVREYYERSAIEAGAQAFVLKGEDFSQRLTKELARVAGVRQGARATIPRAS